MTYSIHIGDVREHKEVLISLWRKNLQGLIEPRFAWIYENNVNGIPVIFLLRHEESDSFVGALTLFPRAIFKKGEKVNAYICGDLLVDAKHRSLGPAMLLLKAAIKKCQEDAPCVLLSFPNEKSKPVTLRVGFKVLGEYREMTKVLKLYRYLARHTGSSFLARALSLPLDWLLQLRYDTLDSFISNRYSYAIVLSFDSTFDELLERMSGHYDFIGERDNCYLNWRIKHSPYSQNEIFVLTSGDKEEVLGYIAFCIIDKRVHIVDMAYGGNNEVFKSLFYLFSKYQREKRHESIVVDIACNSSLTNLFKARGFSLRGLKNEIVSYSFPADMNLIENIHASNWYMTPVDNDV